MVMTAMTAAQLLGAVPFARLGRNSDPVSYLRILITIKALALTALAIAAGLKAPMGFWLSAAATAGLVHGAAYGYMRNVLNSMVRPSEIVRAIGIATTLSEICFVAAPVAASALSAVSPVLAIVVMAFVCCAPALLIPRLPFTAQIPNLQRETVFSPAAASWFICAAAGGAAVAAIEIGSALLAIESGMKAGMGVLFTVALCLASIMGGMWVTLRNRVFGHTGVILLLATMAIGVSMVAMLYSVGISITGCVLVGLTLAPLGSQYSLALEQLVRPNLRSEAFAMLRTANSIGALTASALIAWTTVSVAMASGAALLVAAAVTRCLSRAAPR